MKRWLADVAAIALGVLAAEIIIRSILPTLITKQNGVEQR